VSEPRRFHQEVLTARRRLLRSRARREDEPGDKEAEEVEPAAGLCPPPGDGSPGPNGFRGFASTPGAAANGLTARAGIVIEHPFEGDDGAFFIDDRTAARAEGQTGGLYPVCSGGDGLACSAGP